MNWLAYALLSVTMQSISTILQKNHASKKINHTVITGSLYQIVTGVVIAIYALTIGGHLVGGKIHITTSGLLLVGTALVIYSFGTWAYFKSMYHLNASLLIIILSSRALITTFIGLIFLGEQIQRNQYIGMALIMISIFVSQDMKRIKADALGIFYAVMASVVFGIGSSIERVILKEVDLYIYLTLAFIVPGVLLFYFQKWQLAGKKIFLTKITTGHIVIVGVIGAVAGISSMLSLVSAPSVGHFSFVSQTRVIMVAILAFVFLNERSNIKRGIFAAVLCTFGLVLLA